MDPLDERLTDAGAAWRRSQPEPPELHRLLPALERQPRRLFAPRLALLFAAGLVMVAAIAVAPGVGSIVDRFLNGPPPTPTPTVPVSAVPTATTSPSATPAVPAPSLSPATSQPSDAAQARSLVLTYETALVAGQWRTAFDLLGPGSLTHQAGYASFASERAAFYESVAGRYTVGPATAVVDGTPYAPLTSGADMSRAWLIEVDYPALSGNNAGYDQFVVAPDASGAAKVWPVR